MQSIFSICACLYVKMYVLRKTQEKNPKYITNIFWSFQFLHVLQWACIHLKKISKIIKVQEKKKPSFTKVWVLKAL